VQRKVFFAVDGVAIDERGGSLTQLEIDLLEHLGRLHLLDESQMLGDALERLDRFRCLGLGEGQRSETAHRVPGMSHPQKRLGRDAPDAHALSAQRTTLDPEGLQSHVRGHHRDRHAGRPEADDTNVVVVSHAQSLRSSHPTLMEAEPRVYRASRGSTEPIH